MTEKSKERNWISLFFKTNTAAYSNYFGIEYIPQEILSKIKYKSITRNKLRIEDNDSILCGFYWIAFIKYMFAWKTLLDDTNIFSLKNYKSSDKIIY